MNHGVVIKSTTKSIITEDIQKEINEKIPNIDFDQVNKDLMLYGITIISISNLSHCNKMKEILNDKLLPPTVCLILKESKLIDLPLINDVFSNNYEIIMLEPSINSDKIYTLLNKVLGCSREVSAKLYNNTIFNGESSLGDFPLEIAEHKLQELNKINERRKPPLVVFKLRKIN